MIVDLNPQLISWVIENLVKNSVDAMSGKGELRLAIFKVQDKVVFEVSDLQL